MKRKEARKAEIILEYQNYIENPPIPAKQLYTTACSSDGVTIDAWRNIWLSNIKANKKRFVSFKENSVGQVFGKNKHKPCVIAGSGPSLAYNGELLKNRDGICLISCLHNYHFFEDRGITPDYYVTLDAGDVVIEEVYEGGSKTPEEYWESTKDKTLVAFIGTKPALFDKWQGKVLFFNAPVPDETYVKEVEALEIFNTYMSNGGNVLGACLYLGKAILGSNPIAFVGADFSFSYSKKFHGWDSKYDEKLGYVMKATDVFGNKVLTWQSYWNFKNWFDYIAMSIPGIYINCTEGGTFGAYSEGNLMVVKQMPLFDFIDMYAMHETMRASCETPELSQKMLLF